MFVGEGDVYGDGVGRFHSFSAIISASQVFIMRKTAVAPIPESASTRSLLSGRVLVNFVNWICA